MFDEQAILKNAIAAWQRHHHMTYSLLAQLTDAQLYAPLPRPGLNNLAKHYEELADVQRAYARAFHIGRLDFSSLSREKDYTGIATKAELKTLMEQADKQIYDGVDACPPDRAIDIFGDYSTVTGIEMPDQRFWGRLGSYERNSSHLQAEIGPRRVQTGYCV
jgi:hypothetical protein